MFSVIVLKVFWIRIAAKFKNSDEPLVGAMPMLRFRDDDVAGSTLKIHEELPEARIPHVLPRIWVEERHQITRRAGPGQQLLNVLPDTVHRILGQIARRPTPTWPARLGLEFQGDMLGRVLHREVHCPVCGLVRMDESDDPLLGFQPLQ